MAEHNRLGKSGEDFAVGYLVEKGYRILERNWRTGHLEIDVVAHDGEMMVFVEVKTRSRSQMAADLVSERKRVNVVNAAEEYLRRSGYVGEARIDLLVLTKEKEGFDVLHVPGAFR